MKELIRHIIREHTKEIGEVGKPNKWTDEKLKDEALKYNTLGKFQEKSGGAYITAKKRGTDFFNSITSHFSKSKTGRGNTNEFIKRAKEIHGDNYDYSEVKYVNTSTPVKIKCIKHGFFNQTPNKHLSGQGCPICGDEKRSKSNTTPLTDFIEKANKVHKNKYDYNKTLFNRLRDKVIITCPIHGDFKQIASDHLNGSGCQKCSGNYKLNNEEFIEKSKKVHGDKYDYSKVNYQGNDIPVTIICPLHGEFLQIPREHFNGANCPKCMGRNRSTEEFIELSNKIHHSKYDYSKTNYKNATSKVIIICPKHGEFIQKPMSHLQGQGCPFCNESKGEALVDSILKSSNINFIRQYKFTDCTNKKEGRFCRKLPFDFYIPELNTCIEYDGIQHFQSVLNFGGDEMFEQVKIKDEIKNQYCEENGIKLIRIPYTMKMEDIEPYILKELGL